MPNKNSPRPPSRLMIFEIQIFFHLTYTLKIYVYYYNIHINYLIIYNKCQENFTYILPNQYYTNKNGLPDGIRTRNLPSRSRRHYPVVLRTGIYTYTIIIITQILSNEIAINFVLTFLYTCNKIMANTDVYYNIRIICRGGIWQTNLQALCLTQ